MSATGEEVEEPDRKGTDHQNDVIGDSFCACRCPVCGQKMDTSDLVAINHHIDGCLEKSASDGQLSATTSIAATRIGSDLVANDTGYCGSNGRNVSRSHSKTILPTISQSRDFSNSILQVPGA